MGDTIRCHCCEEEGEMGPPDEFGIESLPKGWGFVFDDDPYAPPLIAVGASAFYACEKCKDPGVGDISNFPHEPY